MNYFIKNKKKNFKKIRYIILTGILFFTAALYAQSGKETGDSLNYLTHLPADSLEIILRKPNLFDNELYYIYKMLSNLYLQTDTAKSLEYARMGVRLADEKNNPFWVAEFYYNLGNIYFYEKPDSSLYYYEQALTMNKQAQNSGAKNIEDMFFLQMRLFYNIGTMNYNHGKYEAALENLFKALKIAENINEPAEVARTCFTVAETYLRMSNVGQAEPYFRKVENLYREVNDSLGLADVYNELSYIYNEKEDYRKALEYGEEANRILSLFPDVPPSKLMDVNKRLAEVWLMIPDYNKALAYARKTVEYARRTNVLPSIADALYALSTVYLKQGKYEESEEIAFQALATDTADVFLNSILYGNIAQANIWLGNSAKGIEYFRKTTNAIRAYSNKNFQSSLSEMEVKYDTEKKELKIADLEKKRKLMVLLGIAGGAVLLLALTTFFLLWRRTVLKRKLAETRIKQLEQEKQLVATQAVLDGETRERARLARDLHDGLGSMLTGAKMSLLEMKKGAKLEYNDVERFDKALGLLDDSVVEMRRVAHHLMPDSLSRFGLKTALSDFCDNYPIISFTYYGDKSRLDPRLEVMIYRSIHELVNNALKYAGASRILVQIMQESDRIAFTVQDDGCGFDASNETKGTGLRNIRNRIASFGGNIQIDSKAGEGTEINGELGIKN